MIIDDNSNYDFVTNKPVTNTVLIQSEYKGRGELLTYYYFLHHKLFDTAVILHDSVFINRPIDFKVDTYKMLWDFTHHADQLKDETRMIHVFQDKTLYNFYKQKHKWKGCFGGMSIITHDYLTYINNKYDISKLLKFVLNRYNRMSFERVIGCLLQYMDSPNANTQIIKFMFQTNGKSTALLGDIHKYCPWGISFQNKYKYSHLPIIKVWTGR
uniref:Nucleotide-diphospho-sugar transferase domain-containing protein n=1 Tax=viral metagenome TaxID=1070528 RepID=A0A6C0JXK0_9ZZZZ